MIFPFNVAALSFRPSEPSVPRERGEEQEMPDRDLPVSLFPRYIQPHEDAATRQRHGAPSNDTEHGPTAVPEHGSGPTRVHHHCSGHVGEVPSEPTEGWNRHNEIRGGHESETVA